MLDKDHLPEHYKKKRRKKILIRVALVLFSWIVFYYAYFHMPIPYKLQRAFTEEKCEEVNGLWDQKRMRCMQGGLQPKK